MNKYLFSILFYLTALTAFGQLRQVSKVLSDIENQKFEDARIKLKNLEKEDTTAELFYSKFIFYYSKANNIADIDSANIFFNKSFNFLKVYESKEKEKLCKNISFCEKSKDSVFHLLEYKTLINYCQSKTKSNILLFLNKYPESSFKNHAVKLVDSLDYSSINNSNDTQVYQNYISNHPNSEYNIKAQNKIFDIDYQNAIIENTIQSLEKFESKYPDSEKKSEIKALIIEKYWEKIKDQKSISELSNFIQRFPNSKFTSTAKAKIEEISWEQAELENSSNGYKNFINQYPNSDKTSLARNRYESLKDNVFPYLTLNKKYKLYDIESDEFVNNEEFEFISLLDSNCFIAANHKKFGIIDKFGKVIIPLTYNNISIINGFLSISLSSKKALFTTKGEKKLDFIYDDIFLSNDFIVTVKSGNSDTSLLFFEVYDTGINKVFSGNFSGIKVISDDLFITEKNGINLIENRYHKNISIPFDIIYEPIYNLCTVELKEKKGVISTNGKTIIPIINKGIVQIENAPYIIVTNFQNQQAIFNIQGEVVLNFQNENIIYLNNNLFSINSFKNADNNDPILLYNALNKEFLNNVNCNQVDNFYNGFAYAYLKGKIGVIDSTGKWIVSPIYDSNESYLEFDEIHEDENYFDDEENSYYSQFNFNNRKNNTIFNEEESLIFNSGLALIKLDTTFGFVNKNGDVVIPIIYNSAVDFIDGITQVNIYENGKLTSNIIDSTGHIILKEYQIIDHISKKRKVLLMKNNLYYVFDLSNKQITQVTKRTGYSDLILNNDFFVANYKGYNVILLKNGKELMDLNIDFSSFDLKQNILSINSEYYRGNYDEAIDRYNKLLNDYPENFTILYMLSLCYNEKGNTYDSKYYLTKALEIEPDSEELRRRRIDLNVESKNWSEVIKDINIILNSYETDFIDTYLYFNRGFAYQELGNTQNALNDYNTVLKNTKNYSAAFNNRGVIYMSQNKFNLALNDYNNALKIASLNKENNLDSGLYHCNKGNALYKLKRNSEACQEWKKAVSLGYSQANYSIRNFCK
jgi:outer membrane protein assembly factor BamD (BamD/ComL family)